MTGHIFDIKKYAIHDGPGIRTTVFFRGCPMECWWCHNPEAFTDVSVTNKEFDRRISVDEVMSEIEKDVIFYDQSGGGATFSGGEPLMQIEFLSGLLKACKEKGIHTAIDTCGYADVQSFQKINPLVDVYLYDLKLMDDEVHLKYTGVSNNIINDNLKNLSKNGNNIRIRIPMIPHVTDTNSNLTQIAQFILSLGNIHHVDLLPFNEFGKSKYKKLNLKNKMGDLRAQSDEEMNAKREIFESFGIKVSV